MEGGTCLQEESDIFIHCAVPDARFKIPGTWSEWSEEPVCRTKENYKQSTRDCQGGFCEGPWLKVRHPFVELRLNKFIYSLAHVTFVDRVRLKKRTIMNRMKKRTITVAITNIAATVTIKNGANGP